MAFTHMCVSLHGHHVGLIEDVQLRLQALEHRAAGRIIDRDAGVGAASIRALQARAMRQRSQA